MTIAIGADHAGFRFKTVSADYLRGRGHEVVDFGTTSEAPVDYPDFIHPAAAAVASGAVGTRAPRPDERDALCAWRTAYDVETLGATDSPETRERAAAFLDAQIADGHAWVATHDGALVSLSAFNAALPDIVQLGGI